MPPPPWSVTPPKEPSRDRVIKPGSYERRKEQKRKRRRPYVSYVIVKTGLTLP